MIRKIILALYIVTVTALSLLPANSFRIPESGLFEHADKLVHMAMYSIFTFLIFFTWPDKFPKKGKQFIPLLYVFAWGTLMEILQGIGGYGRNFNYLDILANTAGFFPGWLVWKLLRLQY